MCSIIVVDYRSIEKTLEYVQHAKEQIENIEDLHIVIVDNAEDSDALDILQEKYDIKKKIYCEAIEDCVYIFDVSRGDIVYYSSGKNLGYAIGNNIGTQIADELYADSYYLISNNDLVLREKMDWSQFQRIFEENDDIAIIGPKIVGRDEKTQSPHRKLGAFSHLILYYWLKGWPFYWRADHDYDGQSKRCYRVMGCFMVVKAEAFRKVGRFDSNTFMFAEEMILSELLKRQGYSYYFYDEYTVLHDHGASVKKAMSVLRGYEKAFESICYYYVQYRNTPAIVIGLAKVNFSIYKSMLWLKEKIKEFIKHE